MNGNAGGNGSFNGVVAAGGSSNNRGSGDSSGAWRGFGYTGGNGRVAII